MECCYEPNVSIVAGHCTDWRLSLYWDTIVWTQERQCCCWPNYKQRCRPVQQALRLQIISREKDKILSLISSNFKEEKLFARVGLVCAEEKHLSFPSDRKYRSTRNVYLLVLTILLVCINLTIQDVFCNCAIFVETISDYSREKGLAFLSPLSVQHTSVPAILCSVVLLLALSHLE